MEERIKIYFDRVRHITGDKERAIEMLRILKSENDYNSIQSINPEEKTLEEALNNFYFRKECRYVQQLLEYFIVNNNFILPIDKNDTVHKLDRFKRIYELLVILFSGHLSFSTNMKKSSSR